MSAGFPEGYRARPATRADAAAMFELIAACDLADDGAVEVTLEDVEVGFGRAGFDPASDTMLVLDGDEIAGYAELYRLRAEADVRPHHRARGIGTALLDWTEERARALGRPQLGQTKTDANLEARQLFLRRGYEPVWTSWILRIGLDEPPPAARPPPGITIRTYRDPDAPAVHRLVDDAFASWPGREAEPYEVWAPQAIGHPSFSPDCSALAFDGDELVGAALAFDLPEASEGWVDQLATRASHRRRGIARSLLLTCFATFRARGRRVAGLSTDSRTGALALYDRVGMRVVRSYTRYRKQLGR